MPHTHKSVAAYTTLQTPTPPAVASGKSTVAKLCAAQTTGHGATVIDADLLGHRR